MSINSLNWIANFIWGIAEDVLRDVYVRGKYRDVILPMVVIRRLDAVLEPNKHAVLDMKKRLDTAGITNQDAALKQASGQAFYNTSPFTLRTLRVHFRKACMEAKEEPLANLVDHLAGVLGAGPYDDFNAFMVEVEKVADSHNVKLTARRRKLLQTALAEKDETARPVVRKTHKPGKVGVDPLHGRFEVTVDGKRWVVEYDPDTELRDTEHVPLLEEGGIEAFFRREVLPHAPDAWIDPDVTNIGKDC